MAIKLIIAGSRTLYPTLEQIDAEVLRLPIWGNIEPSVQGLGEVISLVIGGRSPGGGTDDAGESWAEARGLPFHPEPITDDDWRRWGKYLAPKIRNARMGELGDFLLCWWDAKSSGTCDMAMRMLVRHKPVEVVPMKPTKGSKPRRRKARGA